MSVYAYIKDGDVVEFKDIDPALYQKWIEENNPKKDCYKLVIYNQEPSVTNQEVAEFTFQIGSTIVTQVWTIRNKTQEELRKSWTAYDFLLKFTSQERSAYRLAALTDDNVADFMSLAQAAHEIFNDDPMTILGMNYLVSIGVITEQRKNEILS